MQYGVDIASQRLDDLDQKILETVSELVTTNSKVNVLDCGCGQGGLTLALIKAGAMVTAVDLADYESLIREKLPSAQLNPNQLKFIKMDMWQYLDTTELFFDLVVVQRALHYLPYDQAKSFLINLRRRTNQLFLSVTGLKTAIAEYYPDVDKLVAERWSQLDSTGQELFSISAPVCLYDFDELQTLLAETGWLIAWSRVSDFGNIKIMAVRGGKEPGS